MTHDSADALSEDRLAFVGRFVSGLVHGIRNPPNANQLNAGLLNEQLGGD